MQMSRLLEINASPSLAVETALDRLIKPRLISETIDIVDPVPFDRVALARLLEGKIQMGAWPRPSNGGAGRRAHDHKDAINMAAYKLLRGRMPRLYGQVPEQMGQFMRLAPDAAYDKLVKMRKTAGAAVNTGPSLPITIASNHTPGPGPLSGAVSTFSDPLPHSSHSALQPPSPSPSPSSSSTARVSHTAATTSTGTGTTGTILRAGMPILV